MTDEEWNTSFVRTMGMLLNGKVMEEVDEKGNIIKDGVYLILVNAYWETVNYELPKNGKKSSWEIIFDTSNPNESFHGNHLKGNKYSVNSRSLVMFRQVE